MESGGKILGPAIETRKIKFNQGSAVVEQGCEVGSGRRRRSLVPSNELDTAEVRPLENKRTENRGVPRVDGEGGDKWESPLQINSDDVEVGLRAVGVGVEEGVPPRRE